MPKLLQATFSSDISVNAQRMVSILIASAACLTSIPPAEAWPGVTGGFYSGMAPASGSVTCRNLTTSQSVTIPIVPGKHYWDCKAGGLVVRPNDQISMTVNVTGPVQDGLTAAKAAESCQAIHLSFPALPTGAYWIKRGSSTPYQVFCDMVNAGGGWQVLFNGSDATKWATTFGAPGAGQWGIGREGLPAKITQLRLTRASTGQSLTIPLTVDQIYTCSAANASYYWNGTKSPAYNALHIGITSKTGIPGQNGYVVVGTPCNHDRRGWGFGHRAWIDDKQGWGWDSLDLGPTVFTISVR